MGRKSHSPVRLNKGLTYYARLSVPLKLRALSGKTRLIRSLETTNHSIAKADVAKQNESSALV